ncbi:MAG: DNA polymerase I [Spirochaetaceae bacterium]
MDLYLLDGYSLVYRSYFAFIRNPLRNPAGENSSAIFGFLRSLFSLFREYRPEHFAVVLDSIGPTFRHDEYPEYKSTREATPRDLTAQIPKIEAILGALRIPMIRVEGYEADDVMATLARRCTSEGGTAYLITGDKDLLQLVGEGIRIMRPDSGGFEILGPSEVEEKWGVRPDQIRDYLSLTGDSSDNVPGVRGVGAKTAVSLLSQFDTLDGIYESLEEISSKSQREKLTQDRENAYLSRDLVTLRFDATVDLEGDGLALGTLPAESAVPLLEIEGMKSLVDELKALPQAATGATAATAATVIPDGDRDSSPGRYHLLDTPGALAAAVAAARKAGLVAFDVETDSLDPITASLVGFSFSFKGGEGYYAPLRGPAGAVLPEEAVRDALAELLGDSRVSIVGQNLKYDYKIVSRMGIPFTNLRFDTMLEAWLLDAAGGSYGLDALAERVLGHTNIHFDDLFEKGTSTGPPSFVEVPLDKAAAYAAEDADIALRLHNSLMPRLVEEGLDSLLTDLEVPLIPVLAEMELVGISLDEERLYDYGTHLAEELGELERQVYDLVGHEFNLASTQQLQEVLFTERKLKPVRKTKTGFSTDVAVLQELAREDPVPELILRHRTLAKLKSTYVDALPKLVHPETGRLHTNFNQTGTATGRLSSRDPNLQNIPIREEAGRKIRQAFVPREGWRFVSADYSQIELVVLAALSGDEALSGAFAAGEDVHRATGALIFGVDAGDISSEQRRIAKTINFGVMYGMSGFRLARDLGLPRREADAFIERYFETYSGVRRFLDETVAAAENNGYVTTLFGRRRALPDINSRNRPVRMQAQRIAVNTPIQGTAADIVKRAMLRVSRRLKEEGLAAKMLLQVHDELIVEAPPEELSAVETLLKEEMVNAVELSVPLKVNVETGENWGSLHE